MKCARERVNCTFQPAVRVHTVHTNARKYSGDNCCTTLSHLYVGASEWQTVLLAHVCTPRMRIVYRENENCCSRDDLFTFYQLICQLFNYNLVPCAV
jgi:hypothetical protein